MFPVVPVCLTMQSCLAKRVPRRRPLQRAAGIVVATPTTRMSENKLLGGSPIIIPHPKAFHKPDFFRGCPRRERRQRGRLPAVPDLHSGLQARRAGAALSSWRKVLREGRRGSADRCMCWVPISSPLIAFTRSGSSGGGQDFSLVSQSAIS